MINMSKLEKNPYIYVNVCFESDAELEEEDKLEALGIKYSRNKKGRNFEISPRIIMTDKITGFGPSQYKGITTLHTGDGGFAFLVQAEMDEILSLIYPDADLSIFGLTEEDFEI